MSAFPLLAAIPWKDLKEGKRLGQGAYGVVHLGEWLGRTVAIKKLILDTLTERLAKEFRKEAEVMWRCGESPHIVKVLGICTEEAHPALVLEYMPKGSLYDLLSNEELELPWHLRLRIARDIGKGLSYLHDREIVHRDLKSPNILLDAATNAKLSDFGLAKVRFATESKLQSMNTAGRLVGTLHWLAPEIFTLEPVYTKESDVYAYAIVLYEIASRKIPYAGARVNIEEYVKKGGRPTLPNVTPTPYAELTRRAWYQNPQERPGVRYIVLELERWSLPAAAPTIIPRPMQVLSLPPQPAAYMTPQPDPQIPAFFQPPAPLMAPQLAPAQPTPFPIAPLQSQRGNPSQDPLYLLMVDKNVHLEKIKTIPQERFLVAIQREPQNGVLYFNLGRTLPTGASIRLHDNTTMTKRKLFIKAIDLDPNISMAYCHIALSLPTGKGILLPDGRALNKKQLYLKAIEVDPKNSMAYYYLGVFLPGGESIELFDGRKMTDQQLYLKAIALDPQNADAYYCLGNSLEAGVSIRLLDGTVWTDQQLYLKTIDLDPAHKSAYLSLGANLPHGESIQLFNGTTMSSIQLFLRAIALNPKNAEAYNFLGNCFSYRKNRVA